MVPVEVKNQRHTDIHVACYSLSEEGGRERGRERGEREREREEESLL